MAETFDEAFPHYLVMGMTYEQFWEQDCTLVIPYRKAYQLRMEHENYYAWLQGMYIYEALCDVSPLLHAFASRGTRAAPYSDKPYQPEEKKKPEETNQQREDNAVNFMTKLASTFNKQFREKREASEGASGNGN